MKALWVVVCFLFSIQLFADTMQASFRLNLIELTWKVMMLSKEEPFSLELLETKAYKSVNLFPINPNEIFSVAPSNDVNRFVLSTKFAIPKKIIEDPTSLSIHLAGVGQNYEIYLNGQKIISEMYIDKNTLTKIKTEDGVLVNPAKNLFKETNNTLVIYIAGFSPGTFLDKNHHTGLFFSQGYFISDSKYAIGFNRENHSIVLNGVYFIFGLFYIFIYLKTRDKKYYLYFGIYSILLSIYLFHRTFFIYDLYSNNQYKHQIEYIVLFNLIPVFLFFLHELFFSEEKILLLSKIIMVYSLSLTVICLITPDNYHRTILKLWQYSSIPSLILCLWIMFKALMIKNPLSYPIAIGFMGLFLVNVWDILDAITINTNIRLSQYGFFLFLLVLVFILTNDLLNYQIQIENQKNAFVKFVPMNFLQLLSKHSILDLSLGDQIQREMTILFSDIRSFTTLSETMSPKENFDFINSYLSYSSPVIRNNHGFIDKYLGDGVMALFPISVDHAIDAAIDKHAAMHTYNTNRINKGLRPIRVGIGIHTGNLMLGIIGENERFECTVISDAVNLASRIENLTKVYTASILISEFSYHKISDQKKYNIRIVDRVAVKGKTEPVRIYEVLDGLSPKVRNIKLCTKENFEKGVALYTEKMFDLAKQSFINVLEVDPLDKAATLYLTRISFYKEHGIPLDWDGIDRLEHK